MNKVYLHIVLIILLFCTPVFADTATTADVTEKSSGATHVCGRNNAACSWDPRSNIYSDGGSDDDVVYWDRHGGEWNITNNISTFMTEAQMLQGFTMDSSIGLRDRNYVGGDAFTVQIKVTDGTTTYSDTQEFTTHAGQSYETITSQLIVPENTLAYSLATFGLILEGTSLTSGYNGPQTNAINLTSTYNLINQAEETVLDLVTNAVDDILADSMNMNMANMQINVVTPSGTQSLNIPVTASPGAISMSVPSVGGAIQQIKINTGMSAPSAPTPVAPKVATAVAKVKSAVSASKSDAKKEQKQESKQTKADKAKAVQAIVTRVLQAVSMAGGDTDSTKLALMSILGTPGFRDYQQQEIPDVAFYTSEVPYETALIDPLGSIYALGSDTLMDKMINSQYK
jgi:hypothetical protein